MEQNDTARRGGADAATGPATPGLPARRPDEGGTPLRNDDQEVRDALAFAFHKLTDFVRARPVAALGATAVVAYFFGRSRPNTPPPRRGLF